MNDLYKPPESKLTVDDYGNINLFKRVSAWYTIIFTILTLGLYFPYWLHTRTRILNRIAHQKISAYFANFTALLFVATYVLLIAEVTFERFTNLQVVMQYFTYLPILDLVANILILVWVFKFRNRLQKTFSTSEFNIGIIVTFFFQIVYLQFKINVLIDRQHDKSIQKDSAILLR